MCLWSSVRGIMLRRRYSDLFFLCYRVNLAHYPTVNVLGWVTVLCRTYQYMKQIRVYAEAQTRYGRYGIDRTTLCPKYPVNQ